MENPVIRINKSQSISHLENKTENCNATEESNDSDTERENWL